MSTKDLGELGTGSPFTVETALAALNFWTLERLTAINYDILHGGEPPSTLVRELNSQPLKIAPDPEMLSPESARPLLTMVGLYGPSVGRHFQEAHSKIKEEPSLALNQLFVGRDSIPFLDYVCQVADRTGTGHQDKDAFASLVRWNVPTVKVMWDGLQLSSVRGYFPTNVRTYTGSSGEANFFTLLKKAEAYEAPANEIFRSISRREIAVDGDEAVTRIRLARLLLDGVRSVNLAYFDKDEQGKQSLTPQHFMDVLRQFAVHWRERDIPASGSQDPEFILRDLYLGIDFPHYEEHVRRMFPALLEHERRLLAEAMEQPNISDLIFERLPVSAEDCVTLNEGQLLALVRDYPFLVDYYLLLQANGRVASSHLGLAKQFLFNPMRERDSRGVPDAVVVSNWAGSTGMLERLLDGLTDGCRKHRLGFLGRIRPDLLHAVSGVPDYGLSREELYSRVDFA